MANEDKNALTLIAKIRGKEIKVVAQFNPTSLQISYEAQGPSATGRNGQASGANKAGSNTQRTGYKAKMSAVELFFDTTDSGEDVRSRTLKLAQMIHTATSNQAPVVKFSWGTLLFNGTIDSMTETLSYFNEDGVPLRATVQLAMTMTGDKDSEDRIGSGNGATGPASLADFDARSLAGRNGTAPPANGKVGTAPLTQTQGNETIQSLAGRSDTDWKTVANANNVENPRLIRPGTILNLNPGSRSG